MSLNGRTTPVTHWFIALSAKGRRADGQTGKVMGERPYSAIKIAIALILAALLALGLAYVYDGYIR